jgi:hypothetical protein
MEQEYRDLFFVGRTNKTGSGVHMLFGRYNDKDDSLRFQGPYLRGVSAADNNDWQYGAVGDVFINGEFDALAGGNYDLSNRMNFVRSYRSNNIGFGTSFRYEISSEFYDRRFTGDLAYILCYNRKLTNSEVLQNYYQAPIVTDGLVFAIDAGNLVSYESGSTTIHSLTGSIDGTLTNGVGFSSGNGGSWEFDGVDDRIVTPANSALGTFSDWSMDAWVKYETNGYSGWMIVVDQTTHKNYYKNIMVWLSHGTIKRIAMYDGGWQYSTSTIPVSTWTHIAATTEGNIAKMYINGNLDATRTFNWSNTSNVTRYMGIGGHGDNPSYRFNGNISTVKVYDKVLTANEVAQNYNANINKFN